MVRDPVKIIEKHFADFTKSEREIAAYVLANLRQIPFETGATIAEKVGVSQMTVGRFLRSIGYERLRDLKEDLRSQSINPGFMVTDRLKNLNKNSGEGQDLQANLQRDIEAQIAVYEFVGSDVWRNSIEKIISADAVFVTGFQTLEGIASDFCARLQYLRPDVNFLTSADGTFAPLFVGSAKKPVLILFEMRRYTKYSLKLAEMAKKKGIDVIIICDQHCYWARDYTSNVFALNTESQLFWDSQLPFVSLLSLISDQIAHETKAALNERINQMGELQSAFGVFED